MSDGDTSTEGVRSPAMGDTFCSAVSLPTEDDVRKGVKAGRKAAHSWQTRASEWRQRLVKKSSAMWRDRKNSVAQRAQPPVPFVRSLELLPAVEVGVHSHGRSSSATDGADVRDHMRPVAGSETTSPRIEDQAGDNSKEKDKRKPAGLRKVFSRAQLGARGT